jgi:hypothetical protein
LDRLQEWCLRNKFDLNWNKCKTITFSRFKNPIKHDYRIGGHGLERVEEFKDLGVYMDSKMTFLSHIEAITAKSERMLGFIKRISKEFQDYYALKTLFESLERPNLEYA